MAHKLLAIIAPPSQATQKSVYDHMPDLSNAEFLLLIMIVATVVLWLVKKR
jgi:hypothetical protein